MKMKSSRVATLPFSFPLRIEVWKHFFFLEFQFLLCLLSCHFFFFLPLPQFQLPSYTVIFSKNECCPTLVSGKTFFFKVCFDFWMLVTRMGKKSIRIENLLED